MLRPAIASESGRATPVLVANDKKAVDGTASARPTQIPGSSRYRLGRAPSGASRDHKRYFAQGRTGSRDHNIGDSATDDAELVVCRQVVLALADQPLDEHFGSMAAQERPPQRPPKVSARCLDILAAMPSRSADAGRARQCSYRNHGCTSRYREPSRGRRESHADTRPATALACRRVQLGWESG
jgi:hypothetical protein